MLIVNEEELNSERISASIINLSLCKSVKSYDFDYLTSNQPIYLNMISITLHQINLFLQIITGNQLIES